MLKTYKLITRYPNSPAIGTVVQYDDTNSPYWYDATSEEYSHLWEPIPIEYEIVSIRKTNSKQLDTIHFLRWTLSNMHGISLDHMLYKGACVSSGDYYIETIRRTSDGTLFSIGDEIKTSASNTYCKIYELNVEGISDLKILSTHSWLVGAKNINLLSDMMLVPEYEVQSFKLHKHCIAKLGNDGLYHTVEKDRIGKTFNEMNESEYYINSVKRTSDGEVFTIGDKVKHNTGIIDVITKFSMNSNNDMFASGEKCESTSAYSLYVITHLPKPLFTTIDDVGIFEGDTYWAVNTSPHLWSLWKQTAKERTMLNKNVIAFNCEDDALKYITEHKPVLSVYDLFQENTSLGTITKHTLMELAKSKLDYEKTPK